jgi:hypothetical protein
MKEKKSDQFQNLKGKIRVVHGTDTGRVRDHNEDAAS